MSSLLDSFKSMNDVPKMILLLASVALWIACFIISKQTMEASSNSELMKHNVQQLRNIVWMLYFVYLLNFFYTVNRPVHSMLDSSSSMSVIGLVLSTILVLCITHFTNTCMDANCDKNVVQVHLERVKMLLIVLVVVHVGTLLIGNMRLSNDNKTGGFTAEIMNLLRTPKERSRRD